MGLFDKIKPKYKHSDYKVRLEAVKELDDLKLLSKIAKNDSDWEVRREAVKKIEDEVILADIAKNEPSSGCISSFYVQNYDEENPFTNARFEAVKKIEDEAILADIAKNDTNTDFNCYLKDENNCREQYKIYDVRLEAVKKIEDEAILADIAKNGNNINVRREAIKKITDSEIINDIVVNPRYEDIHNEAIKKVTDRAILEEVVKQSKINSNILLAKSILEKEKIINKRNFTYLNYLIKTSEKEIILDSNIKLDLEDEEYFKEGIEIDVDDITINGNGVSIDGGSKLPFFIITGKNITFKNIKFINGFSKMIVNHGKMCNFVNCIFENNEDCIISNEGSRNALNMNNCNIKENKLHITNLKENFIDFVDCNFEDNFGITSEDNKSNHIFNNQGDSKLFNTIFRNNNGSAIYTTSNLELTNCDFEGNSNVDNEGGAIDNKGNCSIINCNFIDNNAKFGGAILNDYGSLGIDQCYFKGNSAVTAAVLYNDRKSSCNFKNSKLEENTSESGVIYNSGGMGRTAYDGMMGYKAVDAAKLRYHNLEFINNEPTAGITNAEGRLEKY